MWASSYVKKDLLIRWPDIPEVSIQRYNLYQIASYNYDNYVQLYTIMTIVMLLLRYTN